MRCVFFEKQGTYVPCTSVSDAIDALISGDSDYAVIPQENTIGGAVIDYVDTPLSKTEVSVDDRNGKAGYGSCCTS